MVKKGSRVLKLVYACVSPIRNADPSAPAAPRKATRRRRMRTRARRHSESDTRTHGQEGGGLRPTQVA